jgi:hypothetical protein
MMKRPRRSGPSQVCRMHWRFSLDTARRMVRGLERRTDPSAFYVLVSSRSGDAWQCMSCREEHTNPSTPVGLVSGGVERLAVAKDGTSTSPGMSPPRPLDFLLRWRILSLPLPPFFASAGLSGGKGSVILELVCKNNAWRGRRKVLGTLDTATDEVPGNSSEVLLCTSAICDGARQDLRRPTQADHFQGV